MLARTNLRRDDLFFMTLAEVRFVHDEIKKDQERKLGHFYDIADLLALWVVKSGTGLDVNFRKRELLKTLIPNPFQDPSKAPKNSVASKYKKGYSNAKEAEKILKIWKVKQ